MATTTTTRFARRGTVTRTRMVGALVGLSIGVAGLGLTACGSEPSTQRYETLSYAGENPFTPPVGTGDPNISRSPVLRASTAATPRASTRRTRRHHPATPRN